MPKTEYCLYSPTRGYLVRKLYEVKTFYETSKNHDRYWFNGLKSYSVDLVRIFDDKEDVKRAKRFWTKFGNLYSKSENQHLEGSIPDVIILIAGTDIEVEDY